MSKNVLDMRVTEVAVDRGIVLVWSGRKIGWAEGAVAKSDVLRGTLAAAAGAARFFGGFLHSCLHPKNVALKPAYSKRKGSRDIGSPQE